MALTMYNGRDNALEVAGNVAIWFLPAIADTTYKTVTEAEIDAGTAIQCNIREFNPSGSPNKKTEQFLCDRDTREVAGSVDWSIDPLMIQTGNPQEPNPFLDSLVRGQDVYIVRRAGIAHNDAPAAGQRVNVWHCEVDLVEDAPDAANTDGTKFETKVTLSVKDYQRLSVIA